MRTIATDASDHMAASATKAIDGAMQQAREQMAPAGRPAPVAANEAGVEVADPHHAAPMPPELIA
jgi:hypothetical protein